VEIGSNIAIEISAFPIKIFQTEACLTFAAPVQAGTYYCMDSLPAFHSSLITHRLYMPQLGRERTVTVLLPRAYFRYPERQFSVMYMHDGQNLFDHHTAFNRAWGLREVMDALPMKKQFIIAGVYNGHAHRASEYVPRSVRKATAEGEAYIDFMVHTLKPELDRMYRTLPHRENTIICGSSLGGLISFYAATRQGHVFGKAGIFSPSLWVMPEVLDIPPGLKSRIYMVGSSTESKGMKFMLQHSYFALKRAGWSDDQFRIVIKDRGQHNESFWGRNFRQMALWLQE
jgi:predicted alpha/beta superfamily hydrolase